MDYAYTLQSLPRLSGGWLKGVNSTGSTATYDIGGDGKTGSINQYVGRDALGFNLNYFLGDYKAIDAASNATFPAYKWGGGGLPDSMYRPLYNGNISGMATNLRMFQGHLPILYNYKYDQLNRLVSQNAYYNFDATTNSYRDNWDFNYTFHERMSYDANGNIQTTVRHALAATGPALMDSLFYKYYAGTNQLRQVIDHVPDNSYGANAGSIQDIDSQTDTSNYAYDSIGNLIRDKKEGITNVKWNVYGKITEINRTVTPRNNVVKLVYNYDAQGNRIGKVEYQSSGVRFYTWYARDAQGNLMSTYAAVDSFIAAAPNKLDTLVLSRTERQVYGSSRLGVYGYSASMDKGPNSIEFYTSGQYERGWRQYELTNHLGNVLTTISDRKIGVYSGGSLTIGDSIYAAASYYEPHMISATDYYAFGMVSRQISNVNGQPDYRFGFNGKENDNEVKGFGNQQDYGERIYDPRIGRFLSTDPLTKDFPWYTPYQFAGNNPIKFIDLDGAEQFNPDKYVQSDASSIGDRYNKRGTLLHKPVIEPTGPAKMARGMFNTFCRLFGTAVEPAAAAEYGDKVQDKAEAFPLTHDNIGYTAKGMIMGPVELMIQLKKDPGNEELWGEASLFLLPFVKAKPKPRVVVEVPESVESAIARANIEVTFDRHGTMTFASYLDQNLGWYEYSKDKGLTLDLNIPEILQKKGLGTQIFMDAMNSTKATKFTGIWIESLDYAKGASENLIEFRKAVADGATENQAAWSTPSGKMAEKAGFKSVEVKKLKDGIQATFTK